MRTVPNQKIITVHKEPCDKQHYYTAINLDAMREASRDLSAGGFRLWIYYASNQDGYTFAGGKQAVFDAMGMKKDAYDRAQLELIEKGYLTTTGGNKYNFKEKPVEGEACHVAKVYTILPQQAEPTRNTTPLQHNSTDAKIPLPVISRAKVEAMGIEGYSIEAGIITFSTGYKYRLIE